MKKDPIVFIEHILECIELIEEYKRGVTKEEFFKSKQLQDFTFACWLIQQATVLFHY